MSQILAPRWYLVRARRLAAAYVEAALDVHGHDELTLRLRSPAWIAGMSSLVGGPADPETAAHFVADLWRRGLDQERLQLMIDPLTPSVRCGQRPLWLGKTSTAPTHLDPPSARDPARVPVGAFTAPKPTRRHGVIARLAQQVALSPPMTTWHPRLNVPGRGPRLGFALGLVAHHLFASPALDRTALNHYAFGALYGPPYGVAVAIVDDAIFLLERLLHQTPHAPPQRVDRLAEIFTAMQARAASATVTPLSRVAQKERARAAEFSTTSAMIGQAPAPALPPLPRAKRRTARRPVDEDRAAEQPRQADLFSL